MIFTALAAVRGFLGSIPREVWYILAAVLLFWLAYEKGDDAGYERSQAEYAEAARKAAEKARKADDEASKQREADTRRNQENDDARNDAIDRDGRRGLNCERLRRAGYLDADLPAVCRDQGGN